MKSLSRLIFAVAAIVLVLLACNLPSGTTPTKDPSAALTAAALTVQAELTKAAGEKPPAEEKPTATFTPVSAPPPTLPSPPTAIPPVPTSTQNCDKAQFVTDVTYPDGTLVAPNTAFTKTWRLKNIGTCSWTPSYAVVFSSGNQMSGPATQALTGNVNPGQTVDISVNLVAPGSNGDYTGYWKLRNASGVLFAQFYVQIKVAVTSAGFDLHSQAPAAQWVGSAGVVPFGGPDTDSRGFAMYKNGQLLEDGSSPSKILEIHPEWVDDGVMTGIYPGYTVQSGEHFKAKIGFLAFSDGSCGAGNAIFEFNYSLTGSPPWNALGSWTETCDGTLKSVDVNVNSLAGQNVRFALAVLANGSSGQDWAVWVNPRVEVP